MTKRVLITGAASGLGWALTQQYLRDGWYVILVDLDEHKLQEGQSQFLEQGLDQHESLCLNITDDAQVRTQLNALFGVSNGLDLLINNAGITHRSQASLTDPAVFSRVMAVNWSAPVLITQLCLAHLEKASGGGRLHQ